MPVSYEATLTAKEVWEYLTRKLTPTYTVLNQSLPAGTSLTITEDCLIWGFGSAGASPFGVWEFYSDIDAAWHNSEQVVGWIMVCKANKLRFRNTSASVSLTTKIVKMVL